ncbi:hypothetical protein V5E97_08385 [Singulisphaera sp. Ch08]|uniref:Uncharacterized protein n=1 Tax=Singulisphaera sp. Ch08 TaxID=3120278 RepID=A0AAU7CKS0_9BACT
MREYNRNPPIRPRPLQTEALESRTLLSLLLNAKPTLTVVPSASVRAYRHGQFTVTQPTGIRVTGTAQPPIGFEVSVAIYASDAHGQILNNGEPLATVTPNRLGQFNATISVPSRIRKDTNTLVAFETASGTLTSQVTTAPALLSGLNTALTINGTTVTNFSGTLTINAGTISNLSATVANPNGTINELSGPISIDAGTIVSGITGAISTPSGTTLTLSDGSITTAGGTISALTGTLRVPEGTSITVGETPGTIGEINGGISLLGGSLSGSTGTLTGQTGILGASTGSFIQSGNALLGAQAGAFTGATGTIGATSSTLTQTGTADESARGGNLSNGTGTITPTTGNSVQIGTASIAATGGTSTTQVREYAVSDPVTIRIHTRPGLAGRSPRFGAALAHPRSYREVVATALSRVAHRYKALNK